MTKFIFAFLFCLPLGNSLSDYQTKILGTWEFDYNQTQFDCDGKKVDYSNYNHNNGTSISFKSDGTFNGQIWGMAYFGSYAIKGDTLISVSNSPAMEGRQTEIIFGEVTDSLYLINSNCDQKDTLRYIRID